MQSVQSGSLSDSVRQYAHDQYLEPARQRGETSFSINVGKVHKALGLHNRVPLVCLALESRKFVAANALKLIAKMGPPSGQSTTVTYTYEFVDAEQSSAQKEDSWARLRGALKDVFAELGGGEAYLRAERDNFRTPEDSQ